MFDEERFKVLLADYFDESLTGTDRVTFEQMLRTNAKARELFWEAAEHHAFAREWALTSIGVDRAAIIGDSQCVTPFPKKKAGRGPRLLIGLAAAAAVAMAFLYPWHNESPEMPPVQAAVEPEAPSPVAVIALSSEAHWEVPGAARLANDELMPGPLHLKSGVIRIAFYSGTKVWVRGPADLDLISQSELGLVSGAALVEVPAAAAGFKVIAGDLTLTDLGTEFGAFHSRGVNEVHVFDGHVAVKDVKIPESKLMAAGESVRIEKGIWSKGTADYSRFPDRAAIVQKLAYERETRFSEWSRKTAEFTRQPDVLVHYLFSKKVLNGKIQNLVPGASEVTNGTLIGGEWSTGRWEKSRALSFNVPSDRIRLVVPGEYPSMTFLTWIRLDDMPKGLAAVLRAEEMVPGALRLGIDDLGRIRMGVYTTDKTFVSPTNRTPFQWDVAMSRPIMHQEIGHWVQLAAVYDSSKRVIDLYLNGESIVRKNLRYGYPAKVGVAQIGSALVLGEPVKKGRAILGRMDEFAIVGRALEAGEIRAHFRDGKPEELRNMADPVGW
jgi:hypothetical protein